MKEKLIFVLIFASMILSVGSVSAQTPIMGKIYNSGYSDVLSGASVIIYCGSSSLSTTSFNDGAYVVKFEPEVCSYPNSIRVEANKDNLAGSNTGTLIECDGTNCTGDYFSVVNLNLKVQTPSSSSSPNSGGRGFYIGYFNCGNNKCDTGETVNTCPKDCTKETPVNDITELGFNEIPKGETQNKTSDGFFSSISGAFVNVDGKIKTPTYITLLIIIVLGITIGLIYYNRKKSRTHSGSNFY
ncbi:MAG: hypothetical protein AABW51_05505 [Nanoarchaeota archaeon]